MPEPTGETGTVHNPARLAGLKDNPMMVTRWVALPDRGLWNIWTKCNGFEGRPAGGCLAIGRQIRLEFLPVAGHFHPTPHPPLARHPRTHQPLQSIRLANPTTSLPGRLRPPNRRFLYRCWHLPRVVVLAAGWLMRGGSAFWAAGAAQQGHLLWCEASEHHGDDRLFLRHGGVGVALPGGHLAEGVDLFRYARGALG